VDVHLVLDEIRLGEQYVQLTGHKERMSLRSVSVKVTGDADTPQVPYPRID
jgi:hypothetical protein